MPYVCLANWAKITKIETFSNRAPIKGNPFWDPKGAVYELGDRSQESKGVFERQTLT